MLSNAKAVPTLPVVDLSRAKKFYEEKLGLSVLRTDPSPGVMYACANGSGIYIYERGSTKADHTVVSFEVDDVKSEVKALKNKGIVFEEYDMPGFKTVDSIATMGPIKAAWFKDTEGNTLAVSQYV